MASGNPIEGGTQSAYYVGLYLFVAKFLYNGFNFAKLIWTEFGVPSTYEKKKSKAAHLLAGRINNRKYEMIFYTWSEIAGNYEYFYIYTLLEYINGSKCE